MPGTSDASGPDDTSDSPSSSLCQLTAIEPSIANTNDIVMLEGTFAETVMVNFPGGVTAAATVRGASSSQAAPGTLPAPLRASSAQPSNADGSLGQFSQLPSVVLTTGRSNHKAIVIGNYLYVMGGLNRNLLALNTVERAPVAIDGSIGPFELVSGVTLMTARAAFTTAVVGDYLYVTGGFGSTPLDSTERATIGPDGSIGGFSTAGEL